MATPHKHSAVIKAWADGAEVEFRHTPISAWIGVGSKPPAWCLNLEYRVKPNTMKLKTRAYISIVTGMVNTSPKEAPSNLELTFEDGKLVKAEVI